MRVRVAAVAPVVALALLVAVPPRRAGGQPPPEPEAAGKPAEVVVGVYVNQILKVDLKENEFTVSFWVWFRWTSAELKPIETFEVVGAQVDAKENQVAEDLDGGVHYAAVRVRATVKKFFDIQRFPLDNHTLAIAIEDSENEDHKVKYVADVENSRIDPDAQVPGWAIAHATARILPHGYTTNYGDTSLPANNRSTYSRFEFSIDLQRGGLGYFFKLFWGGFMATLIAIMALLIKPTDLDPRFGLGVGAIFAAMASAYVISSSLPDTQSMTLADKMNGVAIFYIFLTILESTISLRLHGAGRERASKLLDRYAFWVLLLTFAYANVVIAAT